MWRANCLAPTNWLTRSEVVIVRSFFVHGSIIIPDLYKHGRSNISGCPLCGCRISCVQVPFLMVRTAILQRELSVYDFKGKSEYPWSSIHRARPLSCWFRSHYERSEPLASLECTKLSSSLVLTLPASSCAWWS